MKAVVWHGKHDVRVESVPDPTLINPRDVIMKITSTAICGSDLHLYDGFVPGMKAGDILGHEFMGEVMEVGKGVRHLKPDDRIVVPCTIACGGCFFVHSHSTHFVKIPTQTRAWRKNFGATPPPVFLAILT